MGSKICALTAYPVAAVSMIRIVFSENLTHSVRREREGGRERQRERERE